MRINNNQTLHLTNLVNQYKSFCTVQWVSQGVWYPFGPKSLGYQRKLGPIGAWSRKPESWSNQENTNFFGIHSSSSSSSSSPSSSSSIIIIIKIIIIIHHHHHDHGHRSYKSTLILGDIPHGLGRIAKWFHQASAAFEPPPADSRYWTSRAPWSTGQQVEERRFNAKDPPKKIPKVVPIHWGLYLFNMFLTFKVSNVSCGYCYLNLCSSKSGSTKGSPGGILSAHWSASLKQWLSDNCLEIVDPHWSTGQLRSCSCHLVDKTNMGVSPTVDGRNPAPSWMVETL